MTYHFGQRRNLLFVLSLALNTAFLIFFLMIHTKNKATYLLGTEDSAIQEQTNLLSESMSKPDNPKTNVNITVSRLYTEGKKSQPTTILFKRQHDVSSSYSVAPTLMTERGFTPNAPLTTKAAQRESAFKTAYRELKQRRNSGYLENILLKFLLDQTRFLHSPNSLCASHRRLIALVTSSCKNVQSRHAIRETWGNDFQKQNIQVVFFVGRCPGASDEISNFTDIVEANFKDSYYNNTVKSLTRYRWFNQYCSDVDAVLMVDDDVMINVSLILEELFTKIGYSAWCMRFEKNQLVRNSVSKWYVPEWAVRDEHFPPYCAGFAYVLNASAMSPLFQASLEVPYISIDDAVFTGYAAEMIGLERNHDHRFSAAKDSKILCDNNAHLASHSYNADGMRQIWKNRREKCRTREVTGNLTVL